MNLTDSIINYRRFLKRRNYSINTIRNYMNILRHFIIWLDTPIEDADSKKALTYIDWLLERRLAPKTINCHIDCIRCFYDYLKGEEVLHIQNPIKNGYSLKLPKPLPAFLKDEDVEILIGAVDSLRDRAMIMIMLRCGLRVDELRNLTVDAVDLPRRRLMVYQGKGRKGRVVYISRDAYDALIVYMDARSSKKAKQLFLVEKGRCKGKPISVRGIQKRIEHYSRITGIKMSCHSLRHTMATQLLNADAQIATIQDLLGHSSVTTTQRYCRVSNLKVKRDYFKSIANVPQYREEHFAGLS